MARDLAEDPGEAKEKDLAEENLVDLAVKEKDLAEDVDHGVVKSVVATGADLMEGADAGANTEVVKDADPGATRDAVVLGAATTDVHARRQMSVLSRARRFKKAAAARTESARYRPIMDR